MAGGLTAGSIDGLSLNVLSNSGEAKYLRIKIKPTVKTELNGLIDFDGFTETSEIVVVRRGDTNLEFALTAAPNPFTNSTELTIHSSYDTEMLLTVTDITGKVIFTSNVFTKKGVSSISIDGSDFDTGIYFVNIESNTYAFSHPINYQI